MTVRTIDEIFRDFVTDGVPASGPFNPHKPDIRDTLKALTEGSDNFPDNRVIRLNNADEGTANNIVVTASVAIPAAAYQVLYILNVTQENTGPVKVSGAINRDLVTNINQPVPAGYLMPGMALLCIDTGTELRLLSYGDAEAILAAAEAAADRAEDAAVAAEAAAGGLLSNFDTVASIEAASIPSLVNYVRTSGYYTVGDGGGALYRKRAVIENDGFGDIVSADGGRWAVVIDNTIDIRQFGGRLNDDAFDNAPIVEEVLKLGTLAIPGNSTISCLSSVDVSDTSVCIIGRSQSTSHLKFIGPINGFTGTHNVPAPGKTMPSFILDNLALVTTNDPALTQNTAIDITYPEGFFAARFMNFGTLTRVAIRGLNTEQNGWGTLHRTDNALNFNFVDCVFNGKDEGGAANQNPIAKTRTQYGVYASGGWVPCEFHFTNCHFYHMNKGIFTTGSFEGLYVSDCALVYMGTAIHREATSYSPNWPDVGVTPRCAWITVKGSHFNFYNGGVRADGVYQGHLQGNAFYHSDKATSDGNIIEINGGLDWDVADNIIHSYAPTVGANGVIIGAGSGNVNIHDNNFSSKGTGIWVRTGALTGNRQRNNIFKGTYTVGTIYEQQAGVLSHGPRNVTLTLSSSLGVPNNGAIVAFNASSNAGGFGVSGGVVTIPAHSGIKRVRVSAGIYFDANATGMRQLQIRKNGAQVYPGAAMSATVLGSVGGGLNASSGILSVTDGDTISVFAYQDSGAALNLQGGGLCWLTVEAVE